ncbi:MAG: hypothetical protein OXH99_13525 [Bryobacterales bacterium]|nr:hypothetical protein [Bryobacterales bacterium]
MLRIPEHGELGLEIGAEMGYSQLSFIRAGGIWKLIVWYPRGLDSLNPEPGVVH